MLQCGRLQPDLALPWEKIEIRLSSSTQNCFSGCAPASPQCGGTSGVFVFNEAEGKLIKKYGCRLKDMLTKH